MSKKTDYSVVYVYGPTRFKENYLNDIPSSRDEGGYLKIGMTSVSVDMCNPDSKIDSMVYEAVLRRCRSQTNTGIPDWCSVYDSFVFPKTNKKIDDEIRNILCNQLYSFENSRNEAMKGDIRPGNEYVYGACRKHIKYTIFNYSYSLFVDSFTANFEELKRLCSYNEQRFDDKDDSSDGIEQYLQSYNVGADLVSRCKYERRALDKILMPGDVVYLTDFSNKNTPVMYNGKQVEAIYCSNNKFSFENCNPEASSSLACRLINKFCNKDAKKISGNDCWEKEFDINGKLVRLTLAKYYDEYFSGKLNPSL